MKKLVRNKTLKNFLLALAINFVWLVVLILLFDPGEKTDDMIMKLFLSGAFTGSPSPYIHYCSLILGKILCVLQNMMPTVAWFEVSQFMLIFASFTMFSFVVIKEKKIKQSLLILIPVLLFFGYEAYIKLTFTKTSGVAMAVGFFLMLYAFKQKEKMSKIPLAVIGCLLAVVGSMYRSKTVKVYIILFVVIFLCEVVQTWLAKAKKDREKIFSKAFLCKLSPILLMLVIFVGCLGLHQLSLKMYENDPAWKAYREYNPLKVELQDYGWPDYMTNIETYTALGVSENDYKLWASYRDYGEDQILTVDYLQQVVDIKNKPSGIVAKVKSYIKMIPDFLETYPMNFLYVRTFLPAMLLLLLFLATDRKGKWLPILLMLGIFMAASLLLFAEGRYNKDHVDFCLWIAAALSFTYLLLDSNIKKEKIWSVGLSIAFVFVILGQRNKAYINTNTYSGSDFSSDHVSAQAIMNFLTYADNDLFVFPNNEYYGLIGAANDTLVSPVPNQYSNIYVLSGYMLPPYQAVMDRYAVNNIYEDLLNRNDIHLVCRNLNQVRSILTYMREHYNDHANCVGAVPMAYNYYIYNFFIDDDLSDDDFLATEEELAAAASDAKSGEVSTDGAGEVNGGEVSDEKVN